MKTRDAIELFGGMGRGGGVRQLARALNISVQAVYLWGDDVPPLRSYQIEKLLSEREGLAGVSQDGCFPPSP
jgi:hypothetical protein